VKAWALRPTTVPALGKPVWPNFHKLQLPLRRVITTRSTQKGLCSSAVRAQGACMTPWNDYAIAFERRCGKPVVICEGTLAEVMAAICEFGRLRFGSIRVALIDRGAQPYTFERGAIEALARDTSRPLPSAARLLPAPQ
jgi:hypothetical protein